MFHRILKASKSTLGTLKTHPSSNLPFRYPRISRNIGILFSKDPSTNDKPKTNTNTSKATPIIKETLVKANSESMVQTSSRINADISFSIVKCSNMKQLQRVYLSNQAQFNMINYCAFFNKINKIYKDLKSNKFTNNTLESHFIDKLCLELTEKIKMEGIEEEQRMRSNLFFYLASIRKNYLYTSTEFDELVDIAFEACSQVKNVMRNQEFSNFLLGCKYLNKFEYLNEICDEVCSKIKKMKLISFCLTFEAYSRSQFIDSDTSNKLGTVLLDYTHIVNKMGYRDFSQLFVFISSPNIDPSLKKELFSHFWERFEYHFQVGNAYHYMVLCKSLVYYGKSDKNNEIIEFMKSTYTLRFRELSQEPRIAQRILRYISETKEPEPKKHLDFLLLLYKNILQPPMMITDIYVYIDAVHSIDTNQLGREQASYILNEFEKIFLREIPNYNKNKGNYQEQIAKLLNVCHSQNHLHQMSPELLEILIQSYIKCYKSQNKRTTFYNFGFLVIEIAGFHSKNVSKKTYQSLLQIQMINGFSGHVKEDFFNFQMQRYLDCLKSMVQASETFKNKAEVREFVENVMMRVMVISNIKYLEDEGCCGMSAKILKILREDLGSEMDNQYIVMFGHILKERFLTDGNSLFLDQNIDDRFKAQEINLNVGEEEILELKEEIKYINF